jgi:hypothetical protein
MSVHPCLYLHSPRVLNIYESNLVLGLSYWEMSIDFNYECRFLEVRFDNLKKQH